MSFLRSLHGKILVFFLLMDVASVGALIATVSASARQALQAQIEEQLQLQSRVFSSSLEEQMDLKWSFMRSLASNTFMVNSVIDSLGRDEYLAPFMQKLEPPGVGGAQTDVWLLDFAGRVIARNGQHPARSESSRSFEHEPWWPGVRDGRPQAAMLQRDGHPRLLIAFPVIYFQHTEGAVLAELDVGRMRELSAPGGFDVALLSNRELLFGSIAPAALSRVQQRGYVPGQRSAFQMGDTFYRVESLEGFSREQGLNWSVVLSVPAGRISGPLQQLRRRMIGAGALLGALFAVLVVWGTRKLLRPLGSIEGTMRRIVEGGDLSQRLRLQSKDELGAISRTFDEMLERLEHRTAELERSRDKLSLLAHITAASPVAIAMVDLQGQVRVWNQAAEKLFAWSREEVSESPFLERLAPMETRAHLTQLVSQADAGHPAEAEVGLLNQAEGLIPVLLLVARIADAAGQPMGYVFGMRDQREVKRLRESLVQSEKMAAVGTLVAGLSHELNNPLAIILGFAQGLAQRATWDERARVAVQSIERQAQRCGKLVRTLLDFSRKKVPRPERVAVPALLERVQALVSGQAQRADIHFEILPAPQQMPELEVSVQEIESALLNLITNALDATPSGGSVSVSARAVGQDSGVELVVKDTGCGMPPEVLQRAFDPFFTTKPVGQGTGLGLSITRSIVEAHGGAIDVKTAPGVGTTVQLWLPAAGAPAQAHRMETATWK